MVYRTALNLLGGFALILLTQTIAFAQTASIVDNAADPRHETASQQDISILFDADVVSAGATTPARFELPFYPF